MFAPASPFSRPVPKGERTMSAVYHQIGVETSISGASPHQLIKLLLNGYFEALSEGKGAMVHKNHEAKGKAIGRAIRIVDEGLKASLDLNAGGEIARNLHDLYGYICIRLSQANLHNDEEALDECVNLMKPVQQAWDEIKTNAGQAQSSRMELQA